MQLMLILGCVWKLVKHPRLQFSLAGALGPGPTSLTLRPEHSPACQKIHIPLPTSREPGQSLKAPDIKFPRWMVGVGKHN
jgi:hypothetical protein